MRCECPRHLGGRRRPSAVLRHLAGPGGAADDPAALEGAVAGRARAERAGAGLRHALLAALPGHASESRN